MAAGLKCVKRGLTEDNSSNEAANYDAKHEKTTDEIARRIEARMTLIGVEWIEDDSSDAEGDTAPGRAVRVLDYACGTGSMSRVSPSPVFSLEHSNCRLAESFERRRIRMFFFPNRFRS